MYEEYLSTEVQAVGCDVTGETPCSLQAWNSWPQQANINIVVKTGLFFKNKYKNINIKHWQIEFDEMKLHKLFFKPAAYYTY